MEKVLRAQKIELIQNSLKHFSITALIGPRQCGKSTISREIAAMQTGKSQVFDLEDIHDLEQLTNLKLTLDPLEGLTIFDEIQRKPDLFPYLRVLVDRFPQRRYILLGSASRDLIEKASESLAGRIQYIEMNPFLYNETFDQRLLLKRGGFPRSYLSMDDNVSFMWRQSYIQSYLERDIPALGVRLSSLDINRLWIMIAHLHGGLLNYSSLGQSMGLSDQTIRRYIALLESTFMIRTLKPWHENINKRQIKTPKIYIRDSGILSSLLNIQGDDIFNHPKIGACWEGYVIEQIIAHHNASNNQAFFWASSNSAELDLMIVKGNQKHGVEIKYSDHPKITQSMHSAMESLGLEQLTIIIPIENADYKLNENIHVMGLGTYLKKQPPI